MCMVAVMTKRINQIAGDYITPGEAAERLYVTPKTLIRMAERGDIRSFTLPSGHRRYLREDIEALAVGETPVTADHSPAVPKRAAS